MRIALLILSLAFTFLNNLFAQNSEGVRGVWVPAPRFTDVMWTHDNVVRFVDELDSLNMNSIFLVSYAETKTIFKSKVLLKNTSYNDINDVYLLANYSKGYKSDTNDPVRDIIDEAHKRNIKVFFWFEYGFMGEGKPLNIKNPILTKHPKWMGIGNDGQPPNYNKNDYYFNAYGPEVQNFLISLISESIKLYTDVDGIQGDDRMPAMPMNSDYDSYTKSLYKKKFNQEPPADFRNEQWVRWRLNILNAFGQKLYKSVKKLNKNIYVSFAPNPYPWSRDNLMQEWPQWCKMRICDLLAVQCYRYDENAYRGTVKGVLGHLKVMNPKQLFAPGIILSNGGSYSKMTTETLLKQINVNRSLGINGEIFFYNKGLKDAEFIKVLRTLYKEKIAFPKLKN